MLSLQLPFYRTSKEIQAKGASSFKYHTALKYFEMIVKSMLWKQIFQQNSTMSTQLKLSFQYRTSRWNGKPKDVDETHLVSEMHWLNFFLSNCHKKFAKWEQDITYCFDFVNLLIFDIMSLHLFLIPSVRCFPHRYEFFFNLFLLVCF